MTVLITMAGMGSRFTREGYSVPKYKIGVKKRTLFEWSILSLKEFFEQEFVFATLKGEDEEWLTNQAVKAGISSCRVISRLELSTGQAETAYDAAINLTQSEPLWIYNIDTYVAQGMKPADMNGFEGCIHVYESSNPSMSFVHYDEFGNVDQLAEKCVISNWATVGMYGFKSIGTFCRIYEQAYQRGQIEAVGGEKYVAPMYRLMLEQGSRLCAPKLESNYVHILGTPAQVLSFDNQAKPPIGNI